MLNDYTATTCTNAAHVLHLRISTRVILQSIPHEEIDAGCHASTRYNPTNLTLELYWALRKPLKYDHEKVKKRLWYILPSSWVFGLHSLFPNFSTSRKVDGFCFLFISTKSLTRLRMLTSLCF